MEKKYFTQQKKYTRFYFFKLTLIVLTALLYSGYGHAQNSYTFTNCGATGSVGPTQTQVNSAYLTTNLNGSVVISPTPGIQTWTVPVTGGYRIEARGGKGYGTNGGRGASIAGDFTLTAGTVLKILVGQQGAPPISPGTNQYGGGGGSFVTYLTNAPLVVAGGGGGSWAGTFTGLSDGTTSINGNAGSNGPTNGVGGTAGGGGGTGGFADGGGGITGNGAGTTGGLAYVNGGTGGAQYGHGGFGGGGGGSSWDNRRGCGGGGYSGGGGAGSTTTGFPEGGGGGSINNGTNQTNTSGANNGDGRVIITELCNISLVASSSSTPVTSICSGSSVTLTTNGVSNYNWSNGNTTSSVIVVNPTVTTTYSLSATSVSACTAFAFLTVTVSSAAPVITVAQTTNNVCLGQSVTFTASGALTYTWSNNITNAVPFTPTATSNYTVAGQNGCGVASAVASVTISPLSVTAISTNTNLCAGSLATLSAFAAAGSYTWLPVNGTGSSVVVSPAATTIYTVTASNGTCIGVGNLTITTIPIPTLTAVASATTICAGETVTLSATGAQSYTWFPVNLNGASVTDIPLSPTQYSVGGTNALGCSSGTTQVVIVNQSPVLTLSTNNPLICNGSSSTLNVTGATNYTWSNNSNANSIVVNPTQSTVYSVIGLNNTNTCTSTGTIGVDVFTPIVSVSGNTAICIGETTTLSGTGANSYTWSNGVQFSNINVSPTANTVYTLSAISVSNSLNCPSTHTIEVTIKPNPTITAVADRTLICRNETVTVTAGGANTYTWSTGATGSSVSITSSLVTTILLNLNGTASNGCGASASAVIQVNSCAGIAESVSGGNLIRVYPNPASDHVIILTESESNITLISQTGQILLQANLNESNDYRLNVSDLANGVYFINVRSGDKNVNEKLIINR